MSMIELINKDKIRADNYISIFLALGYLIFALIFRLEAIMSMIVYPFAALVAYGMMKIMNGVNKKNRGNHDNFVKVLFGIAAIIFSIFFLMFIITQPNVTARIVLNLITFPMCIVGMAAILKGIMIDIYSLKARIVNIIIGAITIQSCVFSFLSHHFFPGNYFLFSTISLIILLVLNILGRAALYLSEFGLSLLSLHNFKLFFYIISDYLLFVDNQGNIVLNKIE